MAAYMLTFLRVDDPEVHARDYLPQGHAILLKYGGRPLAVTDSPEILEGEMPKGRLLLVEFPSKEAARDYYLGPEHRPYKEILDRVASSDLAIFDGLPQPE